MKIFNDFTLSNVSSPVLKENWERAVDRYLRYAREMIARDFGYDAADWHLFNKEYISRHGGACDRQLVRFKQFIFKDYREDTIFFFWVWLEKPELIEDRLEIAFERVYHSNMAVFAAMLSLFPSELNLLGRDLQKKMNRRDTMSRTHVAGQLLQLIYYY